jgi:hypothetical protein
MKRFLFLYIFVSVLCYSVHAQPAFNGKRVQAIKVAYITQTLNLNVEEAQKFWPLYNAYDAEIKKARQANVDDQLKIEENVLNIRKKYKPEFKKVLNDDARVNKVFKVDVEFVEEVKKELKRRQQMRQKAQPTPQIER